MAPFIEELRAEVENSAISPRVDSLAERFARCTTLNAGYVPPQSMLREFIG